MRSKIIKVIMEMSERSKEELKPEARLLEDLGMDELDQIELVMALEDRFGIDISNKEIRDIKTVEELVNLVNGKV